MTRWSSTRARLLLMVLPLVFAIGLGGQAVADHDAVPAAGAVIAVLVLLRFTRVELRLDPQHVVVRNPLWTYRIPYADVPRVTEGWKDLFGNGERHFVGAPLLVVQREDALDLEVYATWWLPEAERAVAREMLIAQVSAVREYDPPDDWDDDEDDEPLDTTEPYDAVREVLLRVDPADLTYLGEDIGHYEGDASFLAGVLREREVTVEDLSDMYDEPPEDLIGKLNALRG